MTNFVDCYLMTPIINEINDPILALPSAIAVCVSGEFFRASGPRIRGERSNAFNDTLPICFRTYRLNFFRG